MKIPPFKHTLNSEWKALSRNFCQDIPQVKSPYGNKQATILMLVPPENPVGNLPFQSEPARIFLRWLEIKFNLSSSSLFIVPSSPYALGEKFSTVLPHLTQYLARIVKLAPFRGCCVVGSIAYQAFFNSGRARAPYAVGTTLFPSLLTKKSGDILPMFCMPDIQALVVKDPNAWTRETWIAKNQQQHLCSLFEKFVTPRFETFVCNYLKSSTSARG